MPLRGHFVSSRPQQGNLPSRLSPRRVAHAARHRRRHCAPPHPHQWPLWIPSRRVAVPQRRATSRLGIRRLNNSATHHAHCSRILTERRRPRLHQLPLGRPQRKRRRHPQRREPGPSRHLRLRPAPQAMAPILDRLPVLRLIKFSAAPTVHNEIPPHAYTEMTAENSIFPPKAENTKPSSGNETVARR